MTTSTVTCDGNPQRSSFAWLPAIVAFVCLEGLVGLQAFLAYLDRFLTVGQMQGRGIAQGLPFIWHFGMWGDFLIVSVLAAYLIGRYFVRWRSGGFRISVAVGFVTAGLFSWIYTLSPIAEAHIQGAGLTAVGWVHLFYMAVVIAVFTQFFVFSGDVPVTLLRVVSVLVFAHVVFGTHMVLGLLKLFLPFDWYPVQPLKSAFGWITLWLVVFGLVWCNFGQRRALFPVDERRRNAEEFLRFLDYVCTAASVGYFIPRLFWSLIAGESPYSVALIALVGGVYQLSRRSVQHELAIGKSVFPPGPDRIPDRLKLNDRRAIALEVTLFMLLYVALAWVAHCILVASFCMFLIACIDLNTRRLINKNIREDFANPRFAPDPAEPGYRGIMDRRGIVEWFLFNLPHLWKETFRVAGCAVALGIASYGYFKWVRDVTFCKFATDIGSCAAYGNGYKLSEPDRIAYTVLIGTLVLNELLTWWWRRQRDSRLLGISAAEA